MKLPDASGIVIDGFPRDVAQALSFEDQVGERSTEYNFAAMPCSVLLANQQSSYAAWELKNKSWSIYYFYMANKWPMAGILLRNPVVLFKYRFNIVEHPCSRLVIFWQLFFILMIKNKHELTFTPGSVTCRNFGPPFLSCLFFCAALDLIESSVLILSDLNRVSAASGT